MVAERSALTGTRMDVPHLPPHSQSGEVIASDWCPTSEFRIIYFSFKMEP